MTELYLFLVFAFTVLVSLEKLVAVENYIASLGAEFRIEAEGENG